MSNELILIPRPPRPSSAAASAVMRGNVGRNTRPELAVRRALWALGYRYRLHVRSLPGKPDICFPSRRKLVLVHGCFWHQHPNPGCPLRTHPRSNFAYWEAKLKRNAQRDAANLHALKRLGWRCKVVWECEVGSVDRLRKSLVRFLGPR